MKISSFTAQVGKSGLARSNRYTVQMTLPGTNYSQNQYRKMMLFCEAVQLPGLNINTTPIRTFGEVREMPYEMNYDPITLSFYVDGDMIIKGIFDEWVQSVQDINTRNFNYYNNYTSDVVKIFVEDLTDKPKYIVALYEVYPKTVSPVQMGYDQKDIMKLSVSFAYKYWRSEALSKSEPKPTKPSRKLEITRGHTGRKPQDFIRNSVVSSDVNSFEDSNGDIMIGHA
jgi:hypothetical protein